MIDYPPLDTSAPTFPSEADLVHPPGDPSRTGEVIAVANFTTVSESIELAGRSIDVSAMDTVLIEN